ncbi:DUF58 domain-containing protein [Blastopirellula retiformator]|uniref:Uncharacterized protein n=1 Tax=Blastopirellula retiformator TaxID=2527970 RepID=A0A5C5V077_9BACT|nr:DUF58 domain-containing protein [Blastopirellula retiformator]TWT31808.1 hypothetical protein Enr8_37330 [Blastopirellula retiformator]
MFYRFNSAASGASRTASPRMGWVLACVVATGLLAGVMWHGRAFIVSGTLLLIIGVGVLAPYLAIRRLRGTLLPRQVRGEVGRPLSLRMQLSNNNIFAWGTTSVQVCEYDPQGGLVETHQCNVTRIDRRGAISPIWSPIPQVRGYFPSGSIEMRTRFPFGLVTATKQVAIESRAIIWPEIVKLRTVLSNARQSGFQSAETSGGGWGDEGDIAGPRPHRPGESMRRVHWRHTARYGELIVCERESTSSRRLRIRLNLTEPGDAYELAISAAASLIAQAVESGWLVDLDIVGVRRWEGIGRHSLNAALDFLAIFDRQATAQPTRPPVARRDAGRFVLVTQQAPADESQQAHYDEVIYVGDRSPEEGVVWLHPQTPWRESLQSLGERIYA